ncbi:MAG TPA: tetratricopeptide repeat protein [Vicinamibacteria bacterium]|nr:tetratricopeptide repeat protein [Vicinamibacteria bacterium]
MRVRRAVLSGVAALSGLVGPSLATAQVAPKTAAPPPAAAKPLAKAPAPGSSEFQALSKRAQAAHEAQRLDEALVLYQKALRLRPRWPEGRFALGTVLYDLDRYEEARTEFRQVTVQEPRSGAAWAFKGMCEFQLRRHEEALADLQNGRLLGLASNPGLKSVADYHAGILLVRFAQFEAAREILSNFALVDQDSPGVIEGLGLAALRMPYLPSEAPPDKREMLTIAGRALFQFTKNRYSPTARLAFDELVTRYPEEPNAHYAKGAFLMTVEEPEAGMAAFRRVLTMQPSHVPAMLQLAFHLLKEGRYEEALPYAESAVKAQPDFFAAHNALGRGLLETGETERAITALETAARLAPNSVQTWFTLARAYQRAGRADDVKRARENFVKLDAALRAEREKTRGVAVQPPSLEPVPPPE